MTGRFKPNFPLLDFCCEGFTRERALTKARQWIIYVFPAHFVINFCLFLEDDEQSSMHRLLLENGSPSACSF